MSLAGPPQDANAPSLGSAVAGTCDMLISHDLAVVHHLCEDVVVLRQGRIVEQGPPEKLFQAAEHPYTQALVAAVPKAEPVRRAPAAPHPQAPLACARQTRG